MGKSPPLLFETICFSNRVFGQQLHDFVAEEMPVTLAASPEVHCLEPSDLERPIPEVCSRFELTKLLPHRDAGLLHHHFSIVQLAQQSNQKRVDSRFVSYEQLHEIFVLRWQGSFGHRSRRRLNDTRSVLAEYITSARGRSGLSFCKISESQAASELQTDTRQTISG